MVPQEPWSIPKHVWCFTVPIAHYWTSLGVRDLYLQFGRSNPIGPELIQWRYCKPSRETLERENPTPYPSTTHQQGLCNKKINMHRFVNSRFLFSLAKSAHLISPYQVLPDNYADVSFAPTNLSLLKVYSTFSKACLVSAQWECWWCYRQNRWSRHDYSWACFWIPFQREGCDHISRISTQGDWVENPWWEWSRNTWNEYQLW